MNPHFRILFPAILTAILSACLSGQREAAGPDSSESLYAMQKFRYTHESQPERDYYVFAPPSSVAESRPLIVYLHGCSQTATDVAVGTRWNELAASEDFIVVYPEQLRPAADNPQQQITDGNGTGCWNWFRPEHWNRDAGEPATIAGITKNVIEQFKVNPAQVFIIGASAGAIMAGTMVATYPDIYAAAGILAGCGYPACSDISGLVALQAMNSQTSRMPVFFMHGSADEVAPLALGLEGRDQWLATNDWLDDGERNFSVSPEPTQITHIGLDDSAISHLGQMGDLCTDGASSPCLGGALGLEDQYPHSIMFYADAEGHALIEFWLVHGLMHNYPGGDPDGSFVDPLGPDITSAAWDFFQRSHPSHWRE